MRSVLADMCKTCSTISCCLKNKNGNSFPAIRYKTTEKQRNPQLQRLIDADAAIDSSAGIRDRVTLKSRVGVKESGDVHANCEKDATPT